MLVTFFYGMLKATQVVARENDGFYLGKGREKGMLNKFENRRYHFGDFALITFVIINRVEMGIGSFF